MLLYAASGQPAEAVKTARARQLLQQEAVSLSFHVARLNVWVFDEGGEGRRYALRVRLVEDLA